MILRQFDAIFTVVSAYPGQGIVLHATNCLAGVLGPCLCTPLRIAALGHA